MDWPAGTEARPIDASHVHAWAELRASAEAVDHRGENYDVDDLVEELSNPKLDAARDTIGVWVGRAMVAYAEVHWRVNVIDVHRVNAGGTVHPDWRGRGLGTSLMVWVIRRAAELHREKHPEAPGEINMFVPSTNVDAHGLLTAYGFDECRYSFTMHRDLHSPVPPARVPDGLQLVGYDGSFDQELREAHNEALQGHWGTTPVDEEIWRTFFTGSRGFRDGLTPMVLDGGKIVSFALGYEYVADTEATGVREVYVGQVGTLRSHRGRGLASATLAALMAEAKEAGFQRAALDVDTANSTGALGLYERLGFEQVSKTTAYRLPLG